MTTMRDVALRCGVSVKTVSRVFNDDPYVSSETRERVLRAMRESNYVPNLLARTFRSGRDTAIAIAVPDLSDPFFATLTHAVEQVAHQRGVAVVIASMGYEPDDERPAMEALLHRMVVGAIATPISTDQSYLKRWQHKTPIVFVDRTPTGIVADSIVSDDHGGGVAATQHLLDHGHTSLAFVGDTLNVQTTRRRLEAYQSVLLDAGMPESADSVVLGGTSGPEMARSFVTFLREHEEPTAIFSSNARCTIGLIPVLQSIGRTDMALVGFGDFPLSGSVRPPISFIEQDPVRLGRTAATRLFQRLDTPNRRLKRQVMLDVALVPCGSGEQPPPRRSRRTRLGRSAVDFEMA
jgi:LacI family transcriptional regulator